MGSATNKNNNSKNRRDPQRPYGSSGPLTHAKFIFEINEQAGSPISIPEAYKTAELGIRGFASEDHLSAE